MRKALKGVGIVVGGLIGLLLLAVIGVLVYGQMTSNSGGRSPGPARLVTL